MARSVLGVDASEAMLQMARRRARPDHVHLAHIAVGAPGPTLSSSAVKSGRTKDGTRRHKRYLIMAACPLYKVCAEASGCDFE